MDTLQIEHYARSNDVVNKFYAGCFAADLLPKKVAGRKFLVVNLCNSSIYSELCHWTCIGVSADGGDLEYFDSSGEPSHKNNRHIRAFIARHTKRGAQVRYNKTQIQHHTSDKCALFVLCFIYARCIGLTHKQYIHLFHKADDDGGGGGGGQNILLQKNDTIVWAFFKKAYLYHASNRRLRQNL